MKEENLSTNGSECETAPVPSISITPSMDSKEIVEQLFQFDAEKITAIANLLRMKAEDSKRKSDQNEVSYHIIHSNITTFIDGCSI